MSAQRGGRQQEINPESGQDIEGKCCSAKITGKFLKENWNAILLILCVYAIAVDPLFFFVLLINEDKKCLQFHNTLYFVAIALRSVADLISLANIILEFRRSYIDKEKAKLGVTERVGNAKRYLRTYFLIDVLAILPLPQVLLRLVIFREIRSSKYSDRRDIFNTLVSLQYVPRALRIYTSWKKVRKQLAKNVPLSCVLNLILYILASQVLGAFWYFFAVNQEMACWQIACEKYIGCIQSSFSCDRRSLKNYTFINDYCPIHETQNTISYDFGIFHEAIQLGILATSNVPRKLVHCFWWGLRNLSSFGQNLQTSARLLETLFALSISIFGLLLFLYFIGNLQLYMQMKKSVQLEKQLNIDVHEFKRKTRIWMNRHDKFPPEIKDKINVNFSKIKKKWKKIRDMESDLPFDWLGPDIREEVKKQLCKVPLLEKVPRLHEQIDKRKLDSIFKRLRPVYYKEGSYIFREGEPIDRMVFITSGTMLKLRTINGQGTVVLEECIENGDNLDEVNKILEWGLKLESSTHGLSNLPISESTLKTHTEVDGFDLSAKELMEVFRPIKKSDHRQQAQGGTTSSEVALCKCYCVFQRN